MNQNTMNVAEWNRDAKGFIIVQRYGGLNIELTTEGMNTPKEAFQLLNRTYYQ
jgi:hypothetical protein